jgi:uncharacterized membrane protein YbhN (UPF0104 family)
MALTEQEQRVETPEGQDAAKPSPEAELASGPTLSTTTWRRLASWLPGLMVMGGLVFAVLHFGDIRRFTGLIVDVRPFWLVLAGMCEAATYVSMAAVWYLALRESGHHRPLREIVPLGVAKLFTDLAFPSGGLSGALLVVRAFGRRKVPSPVAMAALLVELFSFYTAYLLVVLLGLGVLAGFHAIHPAVLVVAVLFSGMAVGVPASILWLRRRLHRPFFDRARRIPALAFLLDTIVHAPTDTLKNVPLIAQTVLLQAAILFLHTATLWVMLYALHEPVSYLAALPSFVIASVVAMLGPIPLGLGTFEAACVAMLGLLGVSLEGGLAATLLFRGFTFWLPMLPGLWITHRELR